MLSKETLTIDPSEDISQWSPSLCWGYMDLMANLTFTYIREEEKKKFFTKNIDLNHVNGKLISTT